MSFIKYDKNTVQINCQGEAPIAIKRNSLRPYDGEVNDGTTVEFQYLIGSYVINAQTYFAVATKVETVSEFWDINRVTDFEIIKISPGVPDQSIVSLIDQGLHLGPLYYSLTHDLSLNCTLQAENAQTCDHFIWNSRPLANLRKITNIPTIGLPVITGYIGVSQVQDKFTFALISRRSCYRAGTRLWDRGADSNGNVANFVETEQILAFPDVVYSLVQIRGSVPMVWSQYPNLSRLPNIALADESACQATLTKHFDNLFKHYGEVTVVSLTDNKGREKEMTTRYNNLGGKAEHVHYQYWDFHHECAKLHWENIDKLIALIQGKIDSIGYSVIKNGEVEQKQNGVVRTNCVDCLDRTNVVQSVIARKNLEKQLQNHGISSEEIDSTFRNLWTDNADALSIQYAGTPALKTDYTRTGKRSIQGTLADGKNAIVRYYVNTCEDGTRQDAYDAITQDIQCKGYKPGNSFLTVLYLALLALIMFVYNILTKGMKNAKAQLKEDKRRAVNYPHFRDVGLKEEPKK